MIGNWFRYAELSRPIMKGSDYMIITITLLIILLIAELIGIILGGTIFALFGDIIFIGTVIWLINRIIKLLKKKK